MMTNDNNQTLEEIATQMAADLDARRERRMGLFAAVREMKRGLGGSGGSKTMTTEFDQVFEDLEAPEYPATCDNCGLTGTNASLVEHDCDDVVECDACEAVVPREEARTGIPAAGVEGTFCATCRGE